MPKHEVIRILYPVHDMRATSAILICIWASSCSLAPDAGGGGPVGESLEAANNHYSPLGRSQGIARLRKALADSPQGVDERDYEGDTPLYYVCAFEKGDFEKAKILLEAGADPLAYHRTQVPSTPLHMVASRDNLPLVKLLLQYVPEDKNDRRLEDRRWQRSLVNWTMTDGSVHKWLLENGYQNTRSGKLVD